MACKEAFLILCTVVVNGVLCKTEVNDEIINRLEGLDNLIRKQAVVIDEQFRLIQNLQEMNEEQDRRIIDLEKLMTTLVKGDKPSALTEDETQIKEGDDAGDEKLEDHVVPEPESGTMGRENMSVIHTYAENSRIDKGRWITSHPKKRYLNKVAFTAYLTLTDGSKRLHNGETIVFNNVLYNEGNDYNIHSGIFSCSMSGVYLFSLSVATVNENAVAKIVIDGQNQLDSIAEGEQVMNSLDVQGSTTLITRVSEGQHVWVVQYYEDNVEVRGWDGYRFTSFSGVLLYPN